MSWTQTDLDALDNAIKRGVKTVTYQTGSVTYYSLDEMLRLRNAMSGAVAGKSEVTRTVGVYDNGLHGGPKFTGGSCR